MPGRAVTVIAVLLAVLAGLALLRLCLGATGFGWPDGHVGAAGWRLLVPAPIDHAWRSVTGLSSPSSGGVDPLDYRLLRLLAACLVGIALSTSGVALQTLLRNPLAEPFILGISSGAAVGVLAFLLVQFHLDQPLAQTSTTLAWVGTRQMAALAGATLTALIVYFAGRKHGMIDPLGLLLTGVILGVVNGAVIMLLNYLVTPAGLIQHVGTWMMGYIDEGTTPMTFQVVTLLLIVSLGLLIYLGRAMDVATFSDAEAMSLGVNLSRLRTILFIVASALAAGAVMIAGPIGFVGLICPHLARVMLGPGHRALLISSALLGAILMTLADSVAVGLDMRYHIGLLPIGIFTAILGGPMFLWMLRPQLGRGA